MYYFGKVKSYFSNKPKVEDEIKDQQLQKQDSFVMRKNSTDSFELIVEQIAEDLRISKQASQNISAQISDSFQPLQFQAQGQQQVQQQIQNMYVQGIVFINKYSQGQQISIQQWSQMIQQQNLSLQSQKNIYYSILKGIHFSVRKRVWELLANTKQMKKLGGQKSYQYFANQQLIRIQDLSTIDKDVPRTVNITPLTKQLRRILIAYICFSQRPYTQGMNLIAGSLIQMLRFQNDLQLSQFDVIEENFQQRVFWVFVGVMKFKGWEGVFQKDFSGMKDMLGKLQKLMVEYVPAVYHKIVQCEWDLTIFSQYYITILLYNTPKDFAKIILDLFLLDGENVIHSLIIRMLKLNQDRIQKIQDQGELMDFFKKRMLLETFQNLQKDKINAKKLEDFQINFITTSYI